MFKLRSLFLAMILVLFISAMCSAELTQQLKIGGQSLQLNGSGARTKTFVQIYQCGLYLLTPSQDAPAILAADELMAVRVNITSSFVSRDALIGSLQEGLKAATGGKTDEISNESKMFVDLLKDEVKKNDIYDFVHVPGKGLYVLKNGSVRGVIPGLAFKKALFGIWLSDRPVDKDLRHAMLSGAPRR